MKPMFEPLKDQPLHIHITIGSIRDGDLRLFFGQDSFNNESRYMHFHFTSLATWADLAVFLRWFPSKSQAAKNGWSGAIPWGYSEHKKGLIRLFILNLDHTDKRTEALNDTSADS